MATLQELQAQYDKELAALQALPAGSLQRIRAKEEFDAKYPTGRPMTVPAGSTSEVKVVSNASETAKKEILAYGLSAGLVALFPDDKFLQDAYNAYLKEDYGAAEELWYKSTFYTSFTGEKKRRALLKANQKPVYDAELEEFRTLQRAKIIGTFGQNAITDEQAFLKLTQEAFDNATNEFVFQQKAADTLVKGKDAKLGGSVGDYRNSLKEFADSFGMSYSDKFYDEWSISIIQGKSTPADAQDKIKQDSASVYKAFANDIMNGKSLEALASAYKSSMATILEVDADTIQWSDATLKTALQGDTVMPLWQFEQSLRKDPRWAYTDNARDSIDNKTRRILGDMGLVM
jgi:hypothetical protein